MSLSRMPNKDEVHSWCTELEIAGIVLKNTQDRASHWCAASVKIYTDHKFAEDILSSKSFKTI